jgi:DNA-directed RNA polymerase subunit RPC12/RpoP
VALPALSGAPFAERKPLMTEAIKEQEQTDALCPECGHAFKAYVDRLVKQMGEDKKKQNVECPVCGCGQCHIGK